MVFFIITHPFYRSIILLIISLRVIIILNRFGNWVNYILCLIYLGGILILFFYISSLIPNVKFSFKNSIFFFFFFIPLGNFVNIDFFESNFIIIFYNFFIFKYFIIFLLFILLIILVSSDFSKEIISPMRLLYILYFFKYIDYFYNLYSIFICNIFFKR